MSVRWNDNMTNQDETKFTQQHLANERTFLAWIRTIISIFGVGFITTTLHLELTNRNHAVADTFVEIIGLFSLLLAFIAAIYAAWSYLSKRRGISTSSFHSTNMFVAVFSGAIIVLLMIMAIYLVFAF